MTPTIRHGQAPLCAPIVALLLAAGCAGIAQNPGGAGGRGADAAIDAGVDRGDSADAPTDAPVVRDADMPRCGDGRLDPGLGEACDDGNTRSGDGCAGNCGMIEDDFDCPRPGMACIYQVRCGDGVLGGIEQCDPPAVGAGCAATCKLEPGFVCDAPPVVADPTKPARCHRTVCGDRTKEGAEACDDGNVVDGDGCSGTCSFEPDCSSGSCVSACGDAVKLAPEACDDGNSQDGDGCSRECQLETGFSCTDAPLNPPEQLNLRVTYRDFISVPAGGASRHPDFEIFGGMGVTPMLVRPMLDAAGKPVVDGRCMQPGVTAACPYDQQLSTAANFDQWYRDAATANVNVPATLVLARLANGSYVYDSGSRGFYPIDNQGWIAAGRETTVLADPIINDGRAHNFGFTTEIRYFFQYRGGESLIFSGDDDVWIFVNRRLALDLGGLHTRTERTLAVDQSAAALGLTVGALYEVVLFHAERHSTGSNFRLTLTGFIPTSSTCTSACGDGVLAATEECDDGNRIGSDGCSSDCRHEIIVDYPGDVHRQQRGR
jgi:fibro-slime domain-containing protein